MSKINIETHFIEEETPEKNKKGDVAPMVDLVWCCEFTFVKVKEEVH